jgi:hypothetical protein
MKNPNVRRTKIFQKVFFFFFFKKINFLENFYKNLEFNKDEFQTEKILKIYFHH